MSRRHASLDFEGRLLRITDLGSTNGTLINGVLVREALLRGGEDVHLGATILRVTRASEPAKVALPAAAAFGRVVGASTEMRRLYPLLERLAASDVTVIIEGETGTGKEASIGTRVALRRRSCRGGCAALGSPSLRLPR